MRVGYGKATFGRPLFLTLNYFMRIFRSDIRGVLTAGDMHTPTARASQHLVENRLVGSPLNRYDFDIRYL
jgi:hypothetical protein